MVSVGGVLYPSLTWGSYCGVYYCNLGWLGMRGVVCPRDGRSEIERKREKS